MSADVHRELEAIERIESPRLIAITARIVRDIGVAQDIVHDAMLAALEQWPSSGVPANPGAWLTATARHRAIDFVRRAAMMERKQYQLVREHEAEQDLVSATLEVVSEADVADDLLRLVFVCCHPVLARPARVALTLRMIGALTTAEIARAFLTRESTIAQRIVRAKRTLADAQVAFECPAGEELTARLPDVLEVIYLIFNEGHSASAGDDLVRPGLCEDALRLGRILAQLLPAESEVAGLVALMELQASRLGARVGVDGEPVLLADQDRSRWDGILIARGLAGLERIEDLGGPAGPYALQAAIAACHARARRAQDTDWVRIAALYASLSLRLRSPVVELNRAVAVAMAFGPAAGLQLVDQLRHEPALRDYHLLPSVRADLLQRLGRTEESRVEFARAAALADNTAARRWLEGRATGPPKPTDAERP